MRLTALRGVGPWTAQIFLPYERRQQDAFPSFQPPPPRFDAPTAGIRIEATPQGICGAH
jgi:hypothetical protein